VFDIFPEQPFLGHETLVESFNDQRLCVDSEGKVVTLPEEHGFSPASKLNPDQCFAADERKPAGCITCQCTFQASGSFFSSHKYAQVALFTLTSVWSFDPFRAP
jgi:hypothetical protein